MNHHFTRLFTLVAVLLAGAGVIAAQGPGTGGDDPITIREQTYRYAGTRECRDCHRDINTAHSDTPHANTLVAVQPDAEDSPIVADFSVGADARAVTFPDGETRPLAAADVAYTLGAGVHVQAYLYQAEDALYVLPVEWNVMDGAWKPLALGDTWPSAAYNFGQQCAGCHTVGLETETYTWEEPGVMCESCHGPGLDHVEAADDAGGTIDDAERAEIYALVNLGLDSATCGSCHVRGLGSDGVHPYPTGYFPGADLGAAFTAFGPDDPVHFFDTGHARLQNMQYNEHVTSAHANSLTNMQAATDDYGPACLECHSSAHLRLEQLLANTDIDPATVTVAGVLAEFPVGVTCATCHDAHMNTADGGEPLPAGLRVPVEQMCVSCHMDTADTDGLHVTTSILYEGAALVEAVQPVPGAHHEAEGGPTCATCHMGVVDTPNGPRQSHTFAIVDPAAALDEETLNDSCSGCHEENPAALGDLIADIQVDTLARVEAARAALADESPAWVEVALDAIERDGSAGLHNYAYTDALLDAVEAELNLLATDDAEA